MSKVHCFTSASFAYLDRVRILGATLKTHHPDWEFWLCLSDEEPAGWTFDLDLEPIDHLVRIAELDLPDPSRFIFEHDVVELCTAVKGPMLQRLLNIGAEKVIYLDPDIAVFSSLSEVVNLLDEHDIVLTPHQLTPDVDMMAIQDNEIGSLKYGIYNLGFIAVANTAEGNRFADWWASRLLTHCFDDLPNGIFTDQRWCDHVPAFFAGTHILRDPGYNVASWNMSQRLITIDQDGSIRAGGRVLRFFHFTKVDWIGTSMIERYSHGRIEVFEILHWYKTLLAANQIPEIPRRYWAFSTYADGETILPEHRSAYRHNPSLREKFPDPFIAGPSMFDAL